MSNHRDSLARRKTARSVGESSLPRAGHLVDRLLAAYLVLLLWNCLIPFELGGAKASPAYSPSWLGLPVSATSTADVLSNILLYIPLGVLVAVRFRRGGRGWLRGVGAAILIAVGIGYGVEYVQQYAPERFASAADFVANVVGATLGAISAPLCHGRLSRMRRQWRGELDQRPLISVVKLYAFVLLVVALIPWTFSLNPDGLRTRLRSASVQATARSSPVITTAVDQDIETYESDARARRLAMERVMAGVYELVTFGVLAALVWRILSSQLGFGRAGCSLMTLWMVGAWATLASGLGLLVRFGSGDTETYWFRLFGCVAGMVLSGMVPESWTERARMRQWAELGCPIRNRTRFPLLPCAVFVILLMGWAPFVYSTEGGGLAAINVPTLLPFWNYFQASPPIAVQDICFKLLRFGALGLVLSMMRGRAAENGAGARAVRIGATCLLVSLVVEVVQMVIPTRHPDTTDLILGFAGGAMGVLFHGWLAQFLISGGTSKTAHAGRRAVRTRRRFHHHRSRRRSPVLT